MHPIHPTIELSPEALSEAIRIRQENANYAGLSLRVYLSGKGCDGFEYGVTFDKADSDDRHFPHSNAVGDLDVIADTRTFGFVGGSKIVWVNDERGRGFVVENPNHRKFRGKFYKSQTWQDRLVKDSAPE